MKRASPAQASSDKDYCPFTLLVYNKPVALIESPSPTVLRGFLQTNTGDVYTSYSSIVSLIIISHKLFICNAAISYTCDL